MKEYNNCPLSSFTTYKLGGKAKKIVIVENVNELVDTYCRFDAYVIGGGSKLLISDNGYDGTVIINRAKEIEFVFDDVVVSSGVYLPYFIKQCNIKGLCGLEFACQIPASVGGAVVMNAGAFDKNISDMVKYVEILEDGKIKKICAKDCEFGYRTSIFRRTKSLITKVCFSLTKVTQKANVEKTLREYKSARMNQPKGRSCGSVFKNGNKFSAILIEKAGLKGVKVGGAEISNKHANFIINNCGSAKDVYTLIRTAKAEVFAQFGEKLNEEVIYLGEFL